MTDLTKNSATFAKITNKIAKISGAKDCKFEIGAVQRNANLVDTFGFLFFSLRGYVEPRLATSNPECVVSL